VYCDNSNKHKKGGGVDAKRLKALREEAGYTQDEFAELLGVVQQQVWRWESGENDPKSETVARMAQLLGVTADFLLGLVDERTGLYTGKPLSPKELRLLERAARGEILEAYEALGELLKDKNKKGISGLNPTVNS
jgi:transcriptional regulator with XRE-family HTH domain